MQHVLLSTYDERRDGKTRIGKQACNFIQIEQEPTPPQTEI